MAFLFMPSSSPPPPPKYKLLHTRQQPLKNGHVHDRRTRRSRSKPFIRATTQDAHCVIRFWKIFVRICRDFLAIITVRSSERFTFYERSSPHFLRLRRSTSTPHEQFATLSNLTAQQVDSFDDLTGLIYFNKRIAIDIGAFLKSSGNAMLLNGNPS